MEFYSGGWAFELLTFAGIALILPQTASQKVTYELGLVREGPTSKVWGHFPHSWGVLLWALAFSRRNYLVVLVLGLWGINRWLNGNRSRSYFTI